MPPHPLTNFEIEEYYQNQARFNGIYSRDNLLKIKDGAYVINLDEHSDIGTHWIDLYVLNNDVTYFESLGVEHILKQIKAFIGNKTYLILMKHLICIQLNATPLNVPLKDQQHFRLNKINEI